MYSPDPYSHPDTLRVSARPFIDIGTAAKLLGRNKRQVQAEVREGTFPFPYIKAGTYSAIKTQPILDHLEGAKIYEVPVFEEDHSEHKNCA